MPKRLKFVIKQWVLFMVWWQTWQARRFEIFESACHFRNELNRIGTSDFESNLEASQVHIAYVCLRCFIASAAILVESFSLPMTKFICPGRAGPVFRLDPGIWVSAGIHTVPHLVDRLRSGPSWNIQLLICWFIVLWDWATVAVILSQARSLRSYFGLFGLDFYFVIFEKKVPADMCINRNVDSAD